MLTASLTVDGDVEPELTAIPNREVSHHLWIAPDRPSRLQGEGLVDGHVMDERARRLQRAESARIRSRRIHHHVGAVFVVLTEVAVDDSA